jgi:serine/threonine protein phosphatase PrpC
VFTPQPPTSDVDVSGLTHPGLVRPVNADHFLIASFHRAMHVHGTSIEEPLGPSETESRGFFLLVADGVGSHTTAPDGSARALKIVLQQLLNATEVCSHMAVTREKEIIELLRGAVFEAHGKLKEAGEEALAAVEATTLTMLAVFWPRAFVLHAGDSRLYRLRDGTLERLTTDQTMAQVLLAAGALTPEAAERSKLKNVLWSAVGAKEVAPEIHVYDCDKRDVVLLCTDGLTKHVTDEEIREHLVRGDHAETVCHALVDLAVARGGTDNVTVVMGRVR